MSYRFSLVFPGFILTLPVSGASPHVLISAKESKPLPAVFRRSTSTAGVAMIDNSGRDLETPFTVDFDRSSNFSPAIDRKLSIISNEESQYIERTRSGWGEEGQYIARLPSMGNMSNSFALGPNSTVQDTAVTFDTDISSILPQDQHKPGPEDESKYSTTSNSLLNTATIMSNYSESPEKSTTRSNVVFSPVSFNEDVSIDTFNDKLRSTIVQKSQIMFQQHELMLKRRAETTSPMPFNRSENKMRVDNTPSLEVAFPNESDEIRSSQNDNTNRVETPVWVRRIQSISGSNSYGDSTSSSVLNRGMIVSYDTSDFQEREAIIEAEIEQEIANSGIAQTESMHETSSNENKEFIENGRVSVEDTDQSSNKENNPVTNHEENKLSLSLDSCYFSVHDGSEWNKSHSLFVDERQDDDATVPWIGTMTKSMSSVHHGFEHKSHCNSDLSVSVVEKSNEFFSNTKNDSEFSHQEHSIEFSRNSEEDSDHVVLDDEDCNYTSDKDDHPVDTLDETSERFDQFNEESVLQQSSTTNATNKSTFGESSGEYPHNNVQNTSTTSYSSSLEELKLINPPSKQAVMKVLSQYQVASDSYNKNETVSIGSVISNSEREDSIKDMPTTMTNTTVSEEVTRKIAASTVSDRTSGVNEYNEILEESHDISVEVIIELELQESYMDKSNCASFICRDQQF